MKSIISIVLIVAWLFAPALTSGPARADEPGQRQIRVTGVGEVLAKPDMATVSLGVVSESKTAGAALQHNSDAMAEIIAAMKAEGIAARDLQTSGFSIQPKYHYPDRNRGETGEPRIVGYTIRNMLTVRIRDLAMTGALLDRMVMLGSNSVNGITFGVAEPGPLEKDARRAAVADARARAELYAATAGVELGDIILIAEPRARSPAPVAFNARAASPIAESAVPVEAGELTFRARIDIVWEIGE